MPNGIKLKEFLSWEKPPPRHLSPGVETPGSLSAFPPVPKVWFNAAMEKHSYWTLGHWRGIPIRLHWSTPIGLVIFTRFEFAPMIWLGFIVIILVHEFGHALLVRRCGAEVVSIDMDALGGSCSWEGEVSHTQRALIAWGGVLAQLVLFVVATMGEATAGWSATLEGSQLLGMLTRMNLFIAAFNLIPFPPLDGWHAWRFIPLVYANRRSRSHSASRQRARRQTPHQPSPLEEVEDFTPSTREVDEFVRKTLKRLADSAADKERKSEDKS